MKQRIAVFLIALLALSLLAACSSPVPPTETLPFATEEKISVIPDSHLGQDRYDPKIYDIDPDAPVVEIPEESVPLASSYVDVTDGISEREAEAIAIHQAGLTNADVSFLHSRLVTEEDASYYHIEFRSDGIPFKFWISAENGQILLYEKG